MRSLSRAACLAILLGGISTVMASAFYYIALYGQSPASRGVTPPPQIKAEVMEIEAETAPSPPPPTADGVPFTQVTLDQLHGMGYLTPSENLAQAQQAGFYDEIALDGWYGASYINASYSGAYLKRVQPGAKVWRDWTNPGWMSLKQNCGITRNGPVQYVGRWVTRWAGP